MRCYLGPQYKPVVDRYSVKLETDKKCVKSHIIEQLHAPQLFNKGNKTVTMTSLVPC